MRHAAARLRSASAHSACAAVSAKRVRKRVRKARHPPRLIGYARVLDMPQQPLQPPQVAADVARRHGRAGTALQATLHAVFARRARCAPPRSPPGAPAAVPAALTASPLRSCAQEALLGFRGCQLRNKRSTTLRTHGTSAGSTSTRFNVFQWRFCEGAAHTKRPAWLPALLLRDLAPLALLPPSWRSTNPRGWHHPAAVGRTSDRWRRRPRRQRALLRTAWRSGASRRQAGAPGRAACSRLCASVASP